MSRKIIGGSPHGRGDAVIDARRAVLLDDISVVVVGTADPTGASRALALELGGRINKSSERSDVLYLFDEDGAAAIISELLGMAGRISPAFLDRLLARIGELP